MQGLPRACLAASRVAARRHDVYPLGDVRLALLVTTLLCACQPSRVSIPEPMVFDLVRPLDAEQGELEANVLATLGTESDDPIAPLVAPEVEYAVADGAAVEFELPFEEGGLAAVKVAGQYTFGGNQDAGFIHGTQVIGERWVDEDVWDVSAIYLPGKRFDDGASAPHDNKGVNMTGEPWGNQSKGITEKKPQYKKEMRSGGA